MWTLNARFKVPFINRFVYEGGIPHISATHSQPIGMKGVHDSRVLDDWDFKGHGGR